MGLALIVVEEHAGRTVHLRDNDPLGTIDDKGALVGHERNIAHVDVLLLDILDRTRAGFFLDLEHDQAKLDLQRCRIGHVALDALFDVVLGLLELVGDVLEHGALIEIFDREHRLEDGLDPLTDAVRDASLALQELFVRGTLNLNEVRHLHGFGDAAERLTDPLTAGEGLRHRCFPVAARARRLYRRIWLSEAPSRSSFASTLGTWEGLRTLTSPWFNRGVPSCRSGWDLRLGTNTDAPAIKRRKRPSLMRVGDIVSRPPQAKLELKLI